MAKSNPITESSVQTDRLKLIIAILIIGTISAIIYSYSRFAFIGNYAPRYDGFVHPATSIFCDFYSIYGYYPSLGYGIQTNYFPGIFLVLKSVAILGLGNPYYAVQYLLAFYLLFLISYLWISFSSIHTTDRILGVFALIACNYPVLFTFHTANFELLCYLLIAYAYLLNDRNKINGAATLIGIAATIKLYPILFLAPLINKKNWFKVGLIGGISFLVFSFLSFCLGGNPFDNFQTWLTTTRKGMAFYSDMMVYSYNGTYFGHSILNAIRTVTGPAWDIRPIFPAYYFIAAIFVLLGIAACINAKQIWMKTLLIACVLSLFPATSQDYKLLYFMIPLLQLMKMPIENSRVKTFIILICLLLIPKTYFYFHGNIFNNANSILNAIIIAILYFSSMFIVLRNRNSVVPNRN